MPTDYTYIQNLPLVTPSDNDKVVMVSQGEARSALAGNLKDKDLRTEVENARNGQLTLSNRLSNIDSTISAETIRAQTEEQSLSDDIASESNRAKLKENDLQNAINDEIARAENAENTINNIITTNKPIWDDKYTQAETDNKISAVVSGLDWKEGVHAYADLETTYPTPQKGWTVSVDVGLNNAPTYYRWDGTQWIDVGLEAIPKATISNDGLMTKEYATKLEGIANVNPTNYVYVGKNGSDTNDGSANKPYLTVQKAIDMVTSGTTLFIFPGTYSENLTFKAGVNLTCATKYTVTITGNHIVDFTGTVICENILFNSNSGNTISFQGTNAQNFQLLGSSVYSNGGDAINWTNTNASSKIFFEDGTVNVISSGTSARAFYSNSTAKGSFILNRVSCKIDTLDNVCLAIGGFLNVSYTADQIIGQVIVSDTATITCGNLSMTTNSVPVLVTNSSGMTTLASVIVNTTSSPIVSGAGAFSFVAILYANTGVGGASTLNGGNGPIALQMASIKLRNASLLPSGAVTAGLVNGEFEFDGTDLYFSKGNTRYVVAMGDVKGYSKVDSLPTSNIKTDYIYLLTTDKSINVYDGTVWSKYGGTGGGHIIKDSANTLPQRSKLQFTGSVSLSDDSTNDTTIVNVTGGSSGDASSINGHIIDNASYATGRPIVASGSGYIHADFNISGIVATNGSILKASGAPATISPGAEVIFGYPSCTADKFLMGIQEVVAGSSVTDTHVDFSDISKYSLQDSGKILIGNNKAQLDIYTKALLHMDSVPFTDVCAHTINNTNVTLDTTNKVFGNGSAYFNGSSYLDLGNISDWNFGSSDFTIDFRIKKNTQSGVVGILANDTSGTQGSGLLIYTNNDLLNVGCPFVNNTSITFATSKNISDNTWHQVTLIRYGTLLSLYVDGALLNSTSVSGNISTPTTSTKIGVRNTLTNYLIGYIDEFRITKKALWTSAFTPPTTAQIGTPYYIANYSTYFQTTGTSDYSLTTIDTITSLTMPFTTPTNTSIKALISFDNGTNWLYHDGAGWHKFTGDITQSWINYNSNTDLQTYFTNLSMTTLKSDLASLNIIPVALDFIWQLNTTDLTVTPSIGQVTMVYTTLSHLEAASFGGYGEQYVSFGVKKILDPTDTTKTNQMSIKNLTSQTKTIIPNVLITTT